VTVNITSMLELEHGFRVVDVHIELEPDRQRRAGSVGDPESVERELRQAGVVRGVVFPADRGGGYLKANNAVARVSVGRPFVPFARVNGPRDPGSGAGSRLRNIANSRSAEHTSPGDVEQFAYDDRFSGFRLNPVVDGLPGRDVLAEMEAAGLPVMTYGGRGFGPQAIADHLLGFDFPVVVSHFGGYPLDETMVGRTVDLLDDHDDLYLETSAVRSRDPVERAVMEHPDRVLFGSGAPTVHPSVGVMEVLTLDITEDAMRKVFSNNAGRVVTDLAP
jgi:predicted TIM-barrel fold metal-dependent hydrolase